MEKLILIGMLLILIGILLVIIGSISLALQGKSKANVAIGGFIGPIPFGFFTSKRAFWLWLLMLAIGIGLWFLVRRVL